MKMNNEWIMNRVIDSNSVIDNKYDYDDWYYIIWITFNFQWFY